MKSITVCVAWLAAMPALAQVPQQLSYEGRLAGLNGTPTTTPVNINFAIWSTADAGVSLWNETQQVTPIDGLYSVTLGAVASNPFPSTLFNGTNGTARFLEITVDNTDILSPRQSIGSVPYSILAGGVQGGPVDATSYSLNGSTVLNGAGRTLLSYTDGGFTSSKTTAGLFCGATGTPTNGQITDFSGATSYRATKVICEGVCKSPTAHMCTSSEMVSSAELGISTFLNPLWLTASSSSTTDDCDSWTSNESAHVGVVWGTPSPGESCDQKFLVACCD